MKVALLVGLIITIFLGLSQGVGRKTVSVCSASFACGEGQLCEVDQVSGSTVSEGAVYAVISSITNIGQSEGTFETNFIFKDPTGAVIDGSVGPTVYYLKPGQTVVLTWQHGFGCTNRLKGEYVLGIGTLAFGIASACNNYYQEGGIGYHEVALLNDTLCAGFAP